jgi:hypothetical protein
MEKNKFINSAGKEYPVTGLSPMEIERIRKSTFDKFVAAGRRLNPPTYTVTAVDGATQTLDHNENTLETDDDRAAFAEYKKATDELTVEGNTKLSRAAMLAVDVDPLKDRRWISRMKVLEIPLPADDFDLLLMYVDTEVLKSVDDIAGLMTAVLYSGGTVDEVGVAAAEASFRVELAKLYQSNADRINPA